jgi:hypothetical protein
LRRRSRRPHRAGALVGRRRLTPMWLIGRGRRGRSALSLLAGLATRRWGRRRRSTGAARCGFRRPAGCLRRGAQAKQQPGPVLGIADGDVLAVADVDRGHPRAVDVDAVSALVDCDPVVAGEPQDQVNRFGPPAAAIVEADVRAIVVADRDVAAGCKRVTPGSNPNGQRRSERLGPHGTATFHHRSRCADSWLSTRQRNYLSNGARRRSRHRPALMA